MSEPCLYTLTDGHADTAALSPLRGLGPLPARLSQLIAFSIGTKPFLLGAGTDGKATLFPLLAGAPYVGPAITLALNVGPFDQVRSFVLANQVYLITYAAKGGDLNFLSIDADGTLSKPYRYSRQRPPALTTGWTTFETLTYLNAPYFLAYNDATGDVDLFAIRSTSVSEAGMPPLVCSNVWAWTWAKGWGHFAFFKAGGENFFFKINTPFPNINIDHLNTDPDFRSNEVGTHLTLPDWQKIGLVRAVSPDGGMPFLLAYQPDGGLASLYRIRADCKGFTNLEQKPQQAVPNASQVATYHLDGKIFALFL